MRNTFIIISLLYQGAFGLEAQKHFGGQTMVGELKRVIVRAPDAAFAGADPKVWHYTAQPKLNESIEEHKRLVDILQQEGAEVIYQDAAMPNHADSIFVHDPMIMTDFGAIILRMGKELRRGEETALKAKVQALAIPVFYELTGEATAEGGDTLWVDKNTLAIGRGFRTNQEGINQIRAALAPKKINVVQVDLPYDQGKEACLHLQSLISMLSPTKAAVYRKYLPVSFVELLESKGIELIDVPESEYPTMGPNILAIKPNVVLTLENNTKTIDVLKKAGCKVYTYKGTEISHKAEGGATCLTRPILRGQA